MVMLKGGGVVSQRYDTLVFKEGILAPVAQRATLHSLSALSGLASASESHVAQDQTLGRVATFNDLSR